MKKILSRTFLLAFLSCSSPKESDEIIGSWYNCNYDGSLLIFKITDKQMMVYRSNPDRYVTILDMDIQNGHFVSSSQNASLVNKPYNPTKILNVTDTSLLAETFLGKFELKKLDEEIPLIDSAKSKEWKKELLAFYEKKSDQISCQDLRTAEEKNEE